MNCPQCGAEVSGSSRNCNRCGAILATGGQPGQQDFQDDGQEQVPVISRKIQMLMIWVPMFMSVVIYVIVGHIFHGAQEPVVPEIVATVLLALAAASVLIGFLVAKISLAEDKIKSMKKKVASQTVQTKSMISIVFIESGAVFGLGLRIVGFPMYMLYATAAVAAIAMIAVLPILLAAVDTVDRMEE